MLTVQLNGDQVTVALLEKAPVLYDLYDLMPLHYFFGKSLILELKACRIFTVYFHIRLYYSFNASLSFGFNYDGRCLFFMCNLLPYRHRLHL